MLYAANIYNFFGGYTLLVIAMNGYVGDVTTAKYETEKGHSLLNEVVRQLISSPETRLDQRKRGK